MKKLSKIIAVLLTVCFMLSGCSYIDGEVFKILENGKNSLFTQNITQKRLRKKPSLYINHKTRLNTMPFQSLSV